jgi:hypothetical protein
MIAADTVQVTRDLWQSWGVTVSGFVGAAFLLTASAKVPGPWRWLFRQLVQQPIEEWQDKRMDRKITDAVGLQAETTQLAVRTHVEKCIAPIEQAMGQINEAVNNVPSGTSKLKDRVRSLEDGQEHMTGQLDEISQNVKALIQRP